MPLEKLDFLMALVEEMLTLALQGAWDELGILQQEQEQLVHELFVGTTFLADSERAALEHVNGLLTNVIELADQEKDEIAQGLRSFNQGKRAQKAYEQNGDE